MKSNGLVMRVVKYSLLTLGLVGQYAAASSVPVEELRPIGTTAPTTAETNRQPIISNVPVQPQPVIDNPSNPSSNNTTAYLLNTIDQMRQELMELRGQMEEQSYRIKQLEQEARDRYLDLDERISRLSQPSATAPSIKGAAASPKVPVHRQSGNAASSASKKHARAEEKAYQAAFGLIRHKKFDKARTALEQQLKQFPAGKYAANAYYWLGEVEMAQGKYPEARTAFQHVLNNFPSSAKVADASYKLGRLYDLMGDKAMAKTLLKSVMKQYPGTGASRLADAYLRTMVNS